MYIPTYNTIVVNVWPEKTSAQHNIIPTNVEKLVIICIIDFNLNFWVAKDRNKVVILILPLGSFVL